MMHDSHATHAVETVTQHYTCQDCGHEWETEETEETGAELASPDRPMCVGCGVKLADMTFSLLADSPRYPICVSCLLSLADTFTGWASEIITARREALSAHTSDALTSPAPESAPVSAPVPTIARPRGNRAQRRQRQGHGQRQRQHTRKGAR